MTLRRKTFLIVSVTMVTLVLFLYVVAQRALINSYLQLEENAVVTDTERVAAALLDPLGQLSRTTADWSYWNDTYHFVQGNNEAYIDDNLGADSLANLGLNFAIFVDSDGRLFYNKFIDVEQEIEAEAGFDATPEFLAALRPDAEDLESQVTGLIEVAGLPLMVSARHILDSQSEGPSAGTLIFGEYLDEARLSAIQDALSMTFALHDAEGAQLPAAWQESAGALPEEGSVFVQPVDGQTVSGYRLLTDVTGEPAYILKVDRPRTLYWQAVASLVHRGASLILFAIVVIIISLVLMDRLVLRRLTQLYEDMRRIRETGDLSLTVACEGSDEIAVLGKGLNELLAEVEQSREQLRTFNRELERRVAERTEALSQSNRALRAEVVEHQQTEMKLAAARDQALEALKLKAQILANVSHDVRTPLNVISLRCEMLLKGVVSEPDPRQQKLLETILFSARELLHFFNNLLEESQTKNGTLQIAREPFSPQELVEQVSLLMAPLAERKSLSWQSEVDATLPEMIYGDGDRLKQVLGNLVDNAIKYTDAGEVRVRLERENHDQWSMIVSDTGAGICEQDKKHIFEAFWQADGSLTRRVNRGVGLGLSIVKELTQLMGGKVDVAANGDGVGSTFVVTLPLQTVEAQAEMAWEASNGCARNA